MGGSLRTKMYVVEENKATCEVLAPSFPSKADKGFLLAACTGIVRMVFLPAELWCSVIAELQLQRAKLDLPFIPYSGE